MQLFRGISAAGRSFPQANNPSAFPNPEQEATFGEDASKEDASNKRYAAKSSGFPQTYSKMEP
jgi:hypothetical protein